MPRKPRKRLQQPATTKLAKLRIQRGMSHTNLSVATGMSESALRHIETKGRIPHLKHQLLIATALGVTPLDLWPLIEDDDETASADSTESEVAA